MPRLPRIDRPNLFYHVMARGNNKARIFFGSEDYRLFEDLLRVCLSRYRLVLHAYCLMPNHILCGAPHKTCNVKRQIM